MVSFAFFTLAIASLLRLFPLDPDLFRIVAVCMLLVLGMSMIVPALALLLERMVGKISNLFGQRQQEQQADFLHGFLTGLSLGIVWTPCAGPIFATIATLAATGNVSLSVMLVTIAYVCGLGIPLFLFTYGGQALFARYKGVSRYTGRIQQLFGILVLLTAVAIYTNYDTLIQAKLLQILPSYSEWLTRFESTATVRDALQQLQGKEAKQKTNSDVNALSQYGSAPEFTAIEQWINTKPLTMQALKGKVVLVDFWTYTCINCIRTLPYVTKWYDTYKEKGFVVVGVHTPEFAFEKKTENVAEAVSRFGITYPVAQDNTYGTWNAFENRYWPAKYLIDHKGIIRYVHFGEGNYDETETAIRTLLQEAGETALPRIASVTGDTSSAHPSPETYLGSKRMQLLYPSGNSRNGLQTFTLEEDLPTNTFSFGGQWNVEDEYARSGQKATLVYHFTGKKVFLVLRSKSGRSSQVQLFLDGNSLTDQQSGKDVQGNMVQVSEDRLYELINLPTSETHILRLEFAPDIEAFAFTFG